LLRLSISKRKSISFRLFRIIEKFDLKISPRTYKIIKNCLVIKYFMRQWNLIILAWNRFFTFSQKIARYSKTRNIKVSKFFDFRIKWKVYYKFLSYAKLENCFWTSNKLFLNRNHSFMSRNPIKKYQKILTHSNQNTYRK
jgi:hypothetical protein